MKKKNLWPLALAITFSLFVCILLIFVVFSHYNTIDLVSADYYEQGLKYQQQIDRINRDEQSVCNLILHYNQADRLLNVRFPDSMDSGSVSGMIILFRPADARQDQKIPLKINNDHQQVINLKNLSKGLWRIKILWQKDRLESYHEKTLIID